MQGTPRPTAPGRDILSTYAMPRAHGCLHALQVSAVTIFRFNWLGCCRDSRFVFAFFGFAIRSPSSAGSVYCMKENSPVPWARTQSGDSRRKLGRERKRCGTVLVRPVSRHDGVGTKQPARSKRLRPFVMAPVRCGLPPHRYGWTVRNPHSRFSIHHGPISRKTGFFRKEGGFPST